MTKVGELNTVSLYILCVGAILFAILSVVTYIGKSQISNHETATLAADRDKIPDGIDPLVFTLKSPYFDDNGLFPSNYTCLGSEGGISPPLTWHGFPEETVEFFVTMTSETPVIDTKYSWVVYNISREYNFLDPNTDRGIFGGTYPDYMFSYKPPCSKGPGAKYYTFTVYALSKSFLGDNLIDLARRYDFPNITDDMLRSGPWLTEISAPYVLDFANLTVSFTHYTDDYWEELQDVDTFDDDSVAYSSGEYEKQSKNDNTKKSKETSEDVDEDEDEDEDEEIEDDDDDSGNNDDGGDDDVDDVDSNESNTKKEKESKKEKETSDT